METTINEKNKLIVKNTLALYFRQIIILFVSLYTSRIVLNTLGITDYGIHNVVSGVIGMLSFMTGSLSETTQRFLSVELGKNDINKLKHIFSNSLLLHVFFILITLILAETIGLWFLKHKLIIPDDRLYASYWVYQFSMVSFIISVFFAPFEGSLRAHENFSFYAKLSVIEAILKLLIAFLILYSSYDKLITYSFLLMCVILINKLILYIYCFKHFKECRIRFSLFKESIRPLLGYNIYMIINSIIAIIRHQGLNLVLNFYYGPALNAAQGIANQIYSTLSSFTNNAALATQPQIIMSYTQNDRQRLWSLIEKSSRLFFYLSLIISLPFILEIHTVLYIWLGNYPDYTPVFTRLFLVENLFHAFMIPIMFANTAVGRLMPVTISSFICRLFILLFAVYTGINGFSPTNIYISVIIFQGIHLIIFAIIVLKFMLFFPLRIYFKDVIFPIVKISIIVFSVPSVLHYFLSQSILSSCLIGIFSLIWSALMVFLIGLKTNEKIIILNKISSFIIKTFKIRILH